MKVFENHHNGKVTIVDYCSNGCQFFHKGRANEIFGEFDVSRKHRNDVLNAFGDVTIPDDIMSYDKLVRRQIARHNEIKLLRQLVNDYDDDVRYEVAKHPDMELLQVLVNDSDEYVRLTAQNTLSELTS